jgi:hypothetical protein
MMENVPMDEADVSRPQGDQFTRRGVNLGLLAIALGLATRRSTEAAPAPPLRTTLFDFAIAGGYYHGLRKRLDLFTPGLVLALRAEPDNPHDVDAVAVHAPDGQRLGYIPREANAPVAKLLREGARLSCEVMGRLDIQHDDDVPQDLVFTGFTRGDPRLRLTLIG